MKKHLMISAAMSALVVAMPAAAQTAGPPSAPSTPAANNPPAAPLEEVVVSGLRASLRDALDTKRESTGVVEVVSSKDIGVLPDVTIAETLNQIPGVNATRDRGNESQVSISGLGPRMVLGLIDGREMASSEPDRNIRWEIFPSEIVSGVQLYKSQQADLVTGGISGTVDIQTTRPLDYTGPSLILRGGPVYYTGGSVYPDQDNLGYRFSGAYVEKLTPDLGLVVAGSFQDQKNGYQDVQAEGWNVGPGNSPGALTVGGPIVSNPWGATYEGKAIDTQRGAVAASLQWKPTNTFEGRIDALYSLENIDEHDQGAYMGNWGNWAGSNAGAFSNNVVQNGALVASTVSSSVGNTIDSEIARYHQDMTLFATGANAKWELSNWEIVGDVAYSQAERASLWQSVVFQNNAGQMSYNFAQTAPSVTAQTSLRKPRRTEP
jgi:TonB-dependent receptor